MSFIFHKYILNSLHIYNSIDVGDLIISNLKLFQKDKLICLTEYNFFIYDILNFNLLYKENISINNEKFRKIELIDYDKFIIYSCNIIVLFKYLEKNTCLKLITKRILPLHNQNNYNNNFMNILYTNNNLIILTKNIYIYNIIKDKDIQLQNHLISNIIPIKIFLLNKKILGFLSNKKIEFWIINHYPKWIYTTNELFTEFAPWEFTKIINIKDNNHILIDSGNVYDNKIYLFSYINRSIIKEFKMYTNGFCLSKNNTLFIIYKHEHICLFDVKKGKLFKINRLNPKLGSNIIIKDDSETFIVDGIREILFLKKSAFKTIFKEALYFFGILLFFLKIFMYKGEDVELPTSLILFTILYLYYRYGVNIPTLIEIDVLRKKYYFRLIGILILIFIIYIVIRLDK